MNDITVSREMLHRMINAIDMIIPTLPGLRDKGSVWLRDEIIKSADELRAALAEPVVKENLTTEYDQTALELCNVCGWKAVIPTEGCLNCEREKQLMKKPPAEPAVEPPSLSPTAGMNIAQRILHVGGRNNAAGYVEFGSIQAVEALVRQVLRDLPPPPPAELAPLPLSDDAIAEAMMNVWGCASIAPRQAPAFARAIEQLIKGTRP